MPSGTGDSRGRRAPWTGRGAAISPVLAPNQRSIDFRRGTPAGLRAELHLSVALLAGIFFLSFPLTLVDKVYAGHQEGYISNYRTVVNNALALVVLVTVCAT